MAKRLIKRIAYRRTREGKTHYRRRLRLLMTDRPRLVIRKSAKHMLVQLVANERSGDKVLLSFSTKELRKHGWTYSCGNMPAAYLAGYAAGKKAISLGRKACIVDLGLQNKGTRLFAAIKGAIDSGLEIPVDPDVLPPQDRLSGEHIAKYASAVKPGQRQFSAIKEPASIVKAFHDIKEKIK
jgi:large subunit ribosomal protein L18